MSTNKTDELPAIGSLWLARDGRIMRVESWFPPGAFGEHPAKMTVLNSQKGGRRVTQADLRRFGKFLQPYTGDVPGE